LERERPEQALQAARETVAMLREFGGNSDLERLAYSFWVQAHLDDDEEDTALQVAREAILRFKEVGNLRQQALMLDLLAGALLAVGCADEARAEITTALELSRTAKDSDLEATLLLRFSTAHGQGGDEEEALQAAEDALAIWEASEEDCSEEAACARYQVAQLLLPRFDPKDTMKEVSMARCFFSHARDSYREAHLLLFIANVTLLGGDVEEAIKTLHVAKDTFREAGDSRGEARALGLIADLCLQQGKYQEAMDMSQRRRATAREAGWAVEEVKALSVISDVARSLEEPQTAARAAREGMRMAKSLGNKKEQVQLLLQAVQCNIQLINSSGGPDNASRNMMEETQRLARDAVLLTTQAGPASGWRRQQRPSALFWQAQVLAMTSLEDAMAVLGQADELCQEVGAQQVRAHCLILGAQLQLHQNNKEKAESMLMPAIELLEQIGDTGGVQYAKEILQKAAGVQAVPSPQAARIEAPSSAESSAPAPPTEIVKKLDAATVRAQLLEIAQNAMASDDDVQDDTPLMDSGMDSLTSVSFRNEVSAAFGTSLPASLIFDYPSIGEITRFVIETAS
jgi:tetratricopeptide (TPR) repeat protein